LLLRPLHQRRNDDERPEILVAAGGGLAIGFQNAARYGLLVWVPVHFLGANWTKADASTAIDPRWISIALPVGMAVGAFSNGWVSDKLFNSRGRTGDRALHGRPSVVGRVSYRRDLRGRQRHRR
jgi:hypothetical protein